MKRCPKCRSFEIRWRETTDHFGYWFQDAGGAIDGEGIFEPGLARRLDGFCQNCSHSWKPRNVHQVTDLPGFPLDWMP